jgi:hypothetical protein
MSSLTASLVVSAFGIALAGLLALGVFIVQSLSKQAAAIAKLETQMSPLWSRVQARISSDLHHPHPRYFEMDRLLEKLEALTITMEERQRLKVLLLERSTDTHVDITDAQRKSAKAMIPIMDMVLLEAKGGEP